MMRISFVELHNEEIKDLLDPISPLTTQALAKSILIREDKDHGIVTLGMKEMEVKKPTDLLRCLEKGSVFRSTGATLMNENSSRSHAIFSITIEIRSQSSPNDIFVAKVRFVDLAGSERAKKTGSVGDRFKEGVNINQGLLALGNVISALGDFSLNKSHVPYRDSKLTRLLQDSLGGNSRTIMIACVSPADSNFGETLNTLKYANRTKNIKNKVIVNVNLKNVELAKLHEKIKTLQIELLVARQVHSGPGAKSSDVACDHITRLQRENEHLRLELEAAELSLREASEEALTYRVKYEHLRHGQHTEEVGDTGSLETGVRNETVDKLMETCLMEIRTLKEEKAKLQVLASKHRFKYTPCEMEGADAMEKREGEVFAVEPEEDETEQLEESDLEERVHREEEKKEVEDYEGVQKGLMATNTELDSVIKEKQILLTKLQRQSKVFHSMKARYEVKCKELEASIKAVQEEKLMILEERENALKELEKEKKVGGGDHMSALAKRKSQLEGRLKEVNRQLAELRHRQLEAERLVRLKVQQETQMKKMEEEIDRLKGQKQMVLSRMKAEETMHRNWRKAWNIRVRELRVQNQELQKKSRKKDLLLKKKTAEVDKANRKIDALKEESSGKWTQVEVVKKKLWIEKEMSRTAKVKEANERLQRGLRDREEKVQQMEELVKEKDKLLEDRTTGHGNDVALDEVNDQVDTLDAQIEFDSERIAQMHNELLPFLGNDCAGPASLGLRQHGLTLVNRLTSLDESKALILALVETIDELKSDKDVLFAKHEEAMEECGKLRQAQEDQLVAMRAQDRTYMVEIQKLQELHTEKELSLLAEIDHTIVDDMCEPMTTRPLKNEHECAQGPTDSAPYNLPTTADDKQPDSTSVTTLHRLLECRNQQISLLQAQNHEFRDMIERTREQHKRERQRQGFRDALMLEDKSAASSTDRDSDKPKVETACVATMTYACPYQPLKEEHDGVAAALQDVLSTRGLNRVEVLENITKKCVELLTRLWQDLGHTKEQQGGELEVLETQILRLCSRELESHEREAQNLRQEEEELVQTLNVLPSSPWPSSLPEGVHPPLHERVNILRDLCSKELEKAKEQLRNNLVQLWGETLDSVNVQIDLELQSRAVTTDLDEYVLRNKGFYVPTLEEVQARNSEIFTIIREVRELIFQIDIDVADSLLTLYPDCGHTKLAEFQNGRRNGFPGLAETELFLKDLNSRIQLQIAELKARLVEQQLKLEKDHYKEPNDDDPRSLLRTLCDDVNRRDQKIKGRREIVRKFEACEALVKNIEEFEVGASQRHRLKGSSIQLLHEEQQRLRFRRKKERLVEDLVSAISSWETSTGERFVHKNVNLKEALHQDLLDTKELGHMCLVNAFDAPRPLDRDRLWPLVQSTPRGEFREKLGQNTPRTEVPTPRTTPRQSPIMNTPRSTIGAVSKNGIGMTIGPRPMRINAPSRYGTAATSAPEHLNSTINRRQTMPSRFNPVERR
eukprot:GEMP01000633.1.p1 GENE.GEMP01000633.1~~GEMP01000633.1.p1  ORF type:complete len:1479 (+),score=394.26 GEMP01000633.1:498-4934(+)